MVLKLVIDNREDNKRIKRLESMCMVRGINYEITNVSVGDYLVMNDDKIVAAFEFKEFADLVSSIKSNHMESQLRDMVQYQNPYLIVHGTMEQHVKKGLNKYNPFSSEQWGGFRAKMALHKVRLIEVDSLDQALYIMISIANRHLDDNKVESSEFIAERHKKSGDVCLDVLCALPNVGMTTAKKYLKAMKPSELFEISHRKDAKKHFKEKYGISVSDKLIESLRKL